MLIVAAESINGHAAAFNPEKAIVIDFIHLLAAAVWSGGLLYLLIHIKNYKPHAEHYLPKFSRAALVSIVALVITGTGSALLYLPGSAPYKKLMLGSWRLLSGSLAYSLI